MIRLSSLLLTPLFLILLLFAGGCQPTSAPPVQPSEPTLRIGISANAPPFAFRQGGEITGLEPALALKLGEYLDMPIQFVEVPWDQQIEFLNQGKTDIIMSGMTITNTRSSVVDF